MHTRRQFLTTTAATFGATTFLPYQALAESQGSNSFKAKGGYITVHPVAHASFVLETPGLVIYNDPVGNASAYSKYPKPNLILISHHHSDHFKPATIKALMTESSKILINPTAYKKLPSDLKAAATQIKNGEDALYNGVKIEAVPAYNYTSARKKYHPKGRDNGYVVNAGGKRIYIAGDTEDVPEMSKLKDIEVAFLPMILPYTMTGEQAAAGLASFRPRHVYAYHYSKDEKAKFDKAVIDARSDTRLHNGPWYS